MIPFLQDYLRFNFLGLMSLLAGFLCFVLGLLVFIKEKSSKVNKAFFYFTYSAANWLIAFGLLNLVQETNDFRFWLSVAYLTVPYIPLATYIFSQRIRGFNDFDCLIKYGYISTAIISLPIIFANSHFCGSQDYSWGRYPYWYSTFLARTFFSSMMLHYVFFASLSFRNFFKYWRNAPTMRERTRGTYLLIGFLTAYTGAVDFLPAILISKYPFGYISVTIFLLIIFYTIVRHQLLDIKILLKRVTLIFGIYSVLLVAVIPASLVVARRLLMDAKADPVHIITWVGLAMGLFLSLGPVVYAAFVRRNYWLRGHVTTGLTHELKSPLGVIESAVGVAMDHLEEEKIDRSKLNEYLNIIQNNATRLQNFVKDLLTVAKTTDDDIALEKKPTDVTEIVSSVLELQRPQAERKGLALVLETTTRVEAMVDAAKIRQVISNIVSNAIKFSESGKVRVSITLHKGELECTVRDQGVGLSQKHLTRIFDRYYQARPGLKGSGIGLSIAKTWVDAHGGKIWAESEGEGKGTMMRFRLPV